MKVALLVLLIACNPPSTHTPVEPAVSATATTTPPGKDDLSTSVAVPEGCTPELAQDPTWSAASLNTAGYRCYKLGQLAEAVTLFDAAITREETAALPHYNLACTLALLRAKGEICPYDATLDHVLDHLERSVALDPERRKRMREDPDLEAVRTTLRYAVLDGAKLGDPASLGEVLPNTRFYKMGGGIFGSTETLEMQAAGKALVHRRTFDATGTPTGWSDIAATWALDGTMLVLSVDGKTARYTVNTVGDLTDGGVLRYTNLPSECSA